MPKVTSLLSSELAIWLFPRFSGKNMLYFSFAYSKIFVLTLIRTLVYMVLIPKVVFSCLAIQPHNWTTYCKCLQFLKHFVYNFWSFLFTISEAFCLQFLKLFVYNSEAFFVYDFWSFLLTISEALCLHFNPNVVFTYYIIRKAILFVVEASCSSCGRIQYSIANSQGQDLFLVIFIF